VNPECYREGKVCYPGESVKDLNEQDQKLLKVACDIEREFYGKLTRVEEIVEFAKRMGFKKIGIAFCIGLFDEAKVIAEVFENAGFEVYSVVCKVGAVDKSELNVEKMRPEEKEAVCNPIAQAEVLNRKGTELNVVVGLCVGHDILFQKYSKAPVTTLIVKDRVLAHNPAGAIYSRYYKRKLLSK
jgi:uncharacterized metal-binding protein